MRRLFPRRSWNGKGGKAMQKLLFRRTLRNLKANFFRYLALFLLIVFAMLIVIGVVGSAESVIGSVNSAAERTHLENGEFGVFVPLQSDTICGLEQKGVELEKCFSLDFSADDGSTLRVMKNRENINLIDLAEGRLAQSDGEIVLERLYAAAHGISVGDSIALGGNTYTVTGIGTTSDYDLCLQNLSDMIWAICGNCLDRMMITTMSFTPTTRLTLIPAGFTPYRQKRT
jgi:putative ABC transport system permease protein